MYINPFHILWLESLPDTSVTFLGGARLLLREPLDELLAKIEKDRGTLGTRTLGESAH
jgi:uncharacterized protein YlzI (FlbEa/FlbD family)